MIKLEGMQYCLNHFYKNSCNRMCNNESCDKIVWVRVLLNIGEA